MKMSLGYYLKKITALNQFIDEMDPKAREEIANGCGAKDALFDFVPDTPLGINLKPPCGKHDVSYKIGQNNEDKLIGDLLFLIYMTLKVIYSRKNKATKILGFKIAMDYFIIVHFKGKKAFYANKK